MGRMAKWAAGDSRNKTRPAHVTVASEPERIGVFLTWSCVHVTDISCGVVYEATLASLVLFRSYCSVAESLLCLSLPCQVQLANLFEPQNMLAIGLSKVLKIETKQNNNLTSSLPVLVIIDVF